MDANGAQEDECARKILSSLATKAFRRPVREDELAALTSFYKETAAAGGFSGPKYLSIQAFSFASSKLPTTISAALSGR